MRRWLYGFMALVMAVMLAGIVAFLPTGQAVPEPNPNRNAPSDNSRPPTEEQLQGIPGIDLRGNEPRPIPLEPEDIVARIRLSDDDLTHVVYRDVTISRDGTVWIDAHWQGPAEETPSTEPGWNEQALTVAAHAARNAPNRAVVIRLYHEGTLMSQQVARTLGG